MSTLAQFATVISCIKLLFYIPYAFLEHFFRLVVPPKLKSLNDEVILVTGAANGIGREICLELVRKSGAKAKLVCWDINKSDLEILTTELKSTGAKVFSYVVDVSDRNQISQAARETKKAVGNLTMLINNAGIIPFFKLLDHKPEDIEKLFHINVLSHFWIIQKFLPDMIENKRGHVVAIASAAGLAASQNYVAYSATKFAVRGYMQALEEEILFHPSKPKIQFSTVYPSFVQTSFDMDRFSSIIKHESLKNMFIMTPDYVARTIVDGVRRNYANIFIPKHISYFLVYGIHPHKLVMTIRKFLGQNAATIAKQ